MVKIRDYFSRLPRISFPRIRLSRISLPRMRLAHIRLPRMCLPHLRLPRVRLLRNFFLFPSFGQTMGFYHFLLTLVFVLLLGTVFYHFLTTLLEITLVVTDAEEELIGFMRPYVVNTLVWIFVLICAFMGGAIFLTVHGASRFMRQTEALQTQIEKLTEADFTARTHLHRKNNFYPLAEQLNVLAQTLEKK